MRMGNRGDALFLETHAAAVSLKNGWTRLASTTGCMWIELTRDFLRLAPHGFIGWLIAALRLDLEHEIPIDSIARVEERGSLFGRGKIEVRFRRSDGSEGRLVLFLKKYREFREQTAELGIGR